MPRVDLTESSVDDLTYRAFDSVRTVVETGGANLSSENTFRFLFAWELGRLLEFAPSYRVDFDAVVFARAETDDRFLDLLVWTDPRYKIAYEFKLPTRRTSGSNTPQTRAKICRDIARLTYLVMNEAFSVKVGYFLCATNEGSYLVQGNKKEHLQYRTHHGVVYQPGIILEAGQLPNGIPRPLAFPQHEIRFIWEGMKETGVLSQRLAPKGKYAWLRPIKIYRA
jgi:hypothetical protein